MNQDINLSPLYHAVSTVFNADDREEAIESTFVKGSQARQLLFLWQKAHQDRGPKTLIMQQVGSFFNVLKKPRLRWMDNTTWISQQAVSLISTGTLTFGPAAAMGPPVLKSNKMTEQEALEFLLKKHPDKLKDHFKSNINLVLRQLFVLIEYVELKLLSQKSLKDILLQFPPEGRQRIREKLFSSDDFFATPAEVFIMLLSLPGANGKTVFQDRLELERLLSIMEDNYPEHRAAIEKMVEKKDKQDHPQR